MPDRQLQKKRPFFKRRWVKKTWRILRPILITAISIGITCYVLYFGYRYVMKHYIEPVDVSDPTPITVVIENSDSASKIASKLYNACGEGQPGLIMNKAVFKVYVDFVGKANKLKAGTYILSKNMELGQMVDIICAGNPPKKTITFKVLEGYTINGVMQALETAGVTLDRETFEKLCNNRTTFEKYAFIAQLPADAKGKRDYLLEGYLFPDTYEIFEDASAETIINKMLLRLNELFTEEHIARAAELGMTTDQIVTLASVIEREASTEEDFKRVSAVFHNRLNAGQKLESCATLQYVLKVNKYVYTESERATDSLYNTYLYEGLPVGPISNPGMRAIEAALYPDEEYVKEDYRYFCNMDLPENKSLIFAKTYEEHQKNIEKYQKYW